MRIQHNTLYEISTSKNIWDHDLTLTQYFHIDIHAKRESITLSLHRNGVEGVKTFNSRSLLVILHFSKYYIWKPPLPD